MSKRLSQESPSVIVGRNPVREALEQDASRIEKVLLQKDGGGRTLDAVRRAASAAGVAVQYVPSHRLDKMAPGLNHQGTVALASPLAYREVHELLAEIAPDLPTVQAQKPMVLVLDQIEDPYNFGAILRSAVAAGVKGVIVPKQHMAPLNAAAIKASAGLANRMPVARAGNLAEVLFQLKERGYWVAGAAGEGTTSVWDMDWDRPLAIVMGSEGSGLRQRIAEACDYLVSIPMDAAAESLNVSVAAGILMFAAARVRTGDGI
jgi:23S rRNA (guanosine2251-2'-O)-methyltransferase